MNYTVQNNTNEKMSTLHEMVDAYFPYAQKEMGFGKSVTIVFESDLENSKNPLGKTAYYDPSNYKVVLYTDNRHPKDIMRSLSHELVHHKQNCNGELAGVTGEQGYAQTEIGSKIEEEAYSVGNRTFRNWEDGVKKRINETNYKSNKGVIAMSLTEDLLREYINTALKKLLKEKTDVSLETKADLEEEELNEEEEELEEELNEEEEELEERAKPENVAQGRDSGRSRKDKDGKRLREKNLSPKQKKKMDKDGDGDIDGDDLKKLRGEEKEEKPLKEWYDNSLYGRLLKEYTGKK